MVHAADGKFAALATAYANHGVFLYIPRGVKIKEPIHSLFWNQGNNVGVFSHNVIWLEDDAEATFVQEYASETDEKLTKFHSGILEVHVGKNASLKLVELQSWGEGVWNVMHERVSVQQNGELCLDLWCTWQPFNQVILIRRPGWIRVLQQKSPVFILRTQINI